VYFKIVDFQRDLREILRKICENHFLLNYSSFPTTVYILTALIKRFAKIQAAPALSGIASFPAMIRCYYSEPDRRDAIHCIYTAFTSIFYKNSKKIIP